MSEFAPQEPAAPATDINENAITREQMLELRDQIVSEQPELFSTENAAVQVPLAAQDIAYKRGGEYPTQDQIGGINAARALGKHIS